MSAFNYLVDRLRMPFDRKLVLDSGLFDAEWYKLAYPHLVHDQVDPLTHFLKYGRKHQLSPGRAFDAARYLDQHADARASRLNPLLHYLKRGRAQGFEIHTVAPSEADRIADSGLFDASWYLARYGDVAAAGYPALLHYMMHGALEGRSPGPDFDAEWYLGYYTDIAGINPLLHYIDHGHAEGRYPLKPSHVIDVAKETIASVEGLDPELFGPEYFANPGGVRFMDGRACHRVARSFKAIMGMIGTPPRALVFMPWLVHGGAELVACHAVRALAQEHGPESVLVVLTDHDREEALHLLPKGVPYISLSRTGPDLALRERVDLVDLLVRGLKPDVVLNVNSHAAWEATKRHGRRLASFSRLYAMLFCPDFSASGARAGYSDLYLRHCLPSLSGIYFDNQSYIDEVTEQFGIPAELRAKLIALPQPAPAISTLQRDRKLGEPLRVLWAGRLMPQKNVDLLIRIAKRAPQFEFHVWGGGSHALELRLADLAQRCAHVTFHGPFERFAMLPPEDYDAFLYTSLWDGIPNILLEASSAGLPVVASRTGGIGELVDAETGWLITELDEPEPYIAALQAIADDPQEMRRRNGAMRARLLKNHNWENYRDILAREPKAAGGLLHDTSDNYGSTQRAS